VTRAREMGRLRRGFAAVESGYVRALGRRGPSTARARPPHDATATDRLDKAHRRVRGGQSADVYRASQRHSYRS
jgi:hypothetical protein